jgi:hypothetical protein
MSAPFDRIVVVDFETAWCRKSGLSLSKQTNEEYIRDPRFKEWGLCWNEFRLDESVSDTPASLIGEGRYSKLFPWVRQNEIWEWSHQFDWDRTALVAQNAQFDASILSWRWGIKPAFIFDTLSMGRALRGVEAGNSLKKLAEVYGLPAKGTELSNSEGYLDELPAPIEHDLSWYCRNDTWLCKQIFLRMYPQFPKSELRLIDMTLKMYVNPMLELDKPMLEEAIGDERGKREALLQRLGVTDKQLASNDLFAQLLRSMHVEPPTKKKKPTKKTPNPVGVNFAFAKNDAHFQQLLHHDNEDVAALCEARLKVKSTTERTRAQRFLDIANRGPLPVPLTYYGALSGRWTAAQGSAINMQNMKRGSFLRKAIMAPEGYVVVAGDLSQIEPRVLAWLSDYHELLDLFRSGVDVYAAFGSQMFDILGMTQEKYPIERQAAKSAVLGCGYQLGWANFAAQLLVGFQGAKPVRYTKEFAKKLGADGEYVARFLEWDENVRKMLEIAHTCTDEELLAHCIATKLIVEKYRATAWKVAAFWDFLGTMLERCLAGGDEVSYKCLIFRKEEIVLPNGMSLRYPNLRRMAEKDVEGKDTGKTNWVYGDDATKLYPGKICNNVTQAVARIVMTDGMLRVQKRYPVVGTVHDELWALAPEQEADAAKTWVLAQMTVEPRYLPGIPLNASGGAHRRYGLAKG